MPNACNFEALEIFRSSHLTSARAMEHPELVESPRKRQKTEAVSATDGAVDALPAVSVPVENAQTSKELEVGITEFVTAENEGFSGILKKR